MRPGLLALGPGRGRKLGDPLLAAALPLGALSGTWSRAGNQDLASIVTRR